MDDQQEKNKSDSFNKRKFEEGRKTLEEDEEKKQKKRKIITIIAAHLAPILIFISCIGAVIVGFLFVGFLDVILDDTQKDTSDAKSSAVVLSVSQNITSQDDNTPKARVKVDSSGSYNITTDYTDEDIIRIKNEIDRTGKNSSDFSDSEIEILGALMDNGLDINDYSNEELKCLPLFIKAEACTQYLDLRPTSEKMQDGKYVPQQLEDNDLENANKIPGVILVQRTNTNSDGPTVLDYVEKAKFDDLVANNNFDATKYFTIDDNGNLVIAKWKHSNVTVTGDYPEKLADSEKVQPEDEYEIKSESIAYSDQIKDCTMPFDFLVQLLLITDEPDFCKDLAKQVLNSKIIINIQEEETITKTTENRTYTVHSKDEKYLNYEVNPAESETNYFLKYAKDDKAEEDNNCTNYSSEEKKVTIVTTYTSHEYLIEITDADYWLAHYTKEYGNVVKQEPEPNSLINNVPMENYQPETGSTITNINEILKDKDAKKFKDDKEEEYKSKVEGPTSVVVSDEFDNNNNKNYKVLKINPASSFDTQFKTKYEEMEREILDENGQKTTIKYYEMPNIFTANNIPKTEFPFKINFYYQLDNKNYTYSFLSDNRDDVIKCNISKLLIKPFYKIDLKNEVTITVIEYQSDPAPKTNTHIYAKDTNGNFEKFLLVYDKYSGARSSMDSVESWLFSMMEETESTVKLINPIKGLLHEYDGNDYGTTLGDIGDLFSPDEFISMGDISSNGIGWWWPIGSSTTEIIDGIEYAKDDPVAKTITSGVGPRWGKNHGGIDIAGDGAQRGTNIIASKAGTVVKVTDEYEDGYYGSKDGGGYGNMVKIQHGDGTYSIYAHLQKGTIKVKQGDRVNQGQVIGGMGTSGSSTGIHLHFEIQDANGTKLDPEEYVNPNNPRPSSSIESPAFTLAGRNQSYYKLNDDQVKTFVAVIIGEGGTDLESVFWTASAMFNRIDARYYGDTDAMKILTKGWSEVYNKGIYKKYLNSISDEVFQVVQEVMNGKRAHKYIDFACDVPGYPLASNWIKNHQGQKYEWFKGNMYCDWRDTIN